MLQPDELLPRKPLGRATPAAVAGTAGSARPGAGFHQDALPRQRGSKHPLLQHADNVKVSINILHEPLLCQPSIKGCQGEGKNLISKGQN